MKLRCLLLAIVLLFVAGCSSSKSDENVLVTESDSETEGDSEITKTSLLTTSDWEIFKEAVSAKSKKITFKNIKTGNSQSYALDNADLVRINDEGTMAAVSFMPSEGRLEYQLIDLLHENAINFTIAGQQDSFMDKNLQIKELYLEDPSNWLTDNLLQIEFAFYNMDDTLHYGRYNLNVAEMSAEDILTWPVDDRGFCPGMAEYDIERLRVEELNQTTSYGQYAWPRLGTHYGLLTDDQDSLQLYGYIYPGLIGMTNMTDRILVKSPAGFQAFAWDADMNNSSHQVFAADFDQDGIDEIICIVYTSGGTKVVLQTLHILEQDQEDVLVEIDALDPEACEAILNQRLQLQYIQEEQKLILTIDGVTSEIHKTEFPAAVIDEFRWGSIYLYESHADKISLTIDNLWVRFSDGQQVSIGSLEIEILYENNQLIMGDITYNND